MQNKKTELKNMPVIALVLFSAISFYFFSKGFVGLHAGEVYFKLSKGGREILISGLGSQFVSWGCIIMAVGLFLFGVFAFLHKGEIKHRGTINFIAVVCVVGFVLCIIGLYVNA